MSRLAQSISQNLREILGEVSIETLMEPRLIQTLKDVQAELLKEGGLHG